MAKTAKARPAKSYDRGKSKGCSMGETLKPDMADHIWKEKGSYQTLCGIMSIDRNSRR